MSTTQQKMAMQKNTQDKIIDATLYEISTYGIENLTTKKISKRAETSTGIIHHHFESKEKLVFSTYKNLIKKQLQKIHDARLQSHDDPIARIKATALANFDKKLINQQNARVWSQLWANAMHKDEVKQLLKDFNGKCFKSIESDFKEFCGSQLAREFALTVVALIHGYWIELQITKNASIKECVIAINNCIDNAVFQSRK